MDITKYQLIKIRNISRAAWDYLMMGDVDGCIVVSFSSDSGFYQDIYQHWLDVTAPTECFDELESIIEALGYLYADYREFTLSRGDD